MTSVNTRALRYFPVIRDGVNEVLIYESPRERVWRSKHQIGRHQREYTIERLKDGEFFISQVIQG